jgi:hypothetical protein
MPAADLSRPKRPTDPVLSLLSAMEWSELAACERVRSTLRDVPGPTKDLTREAWGWLRGNVVLMQVGLIQRGIPH